jgi:tetratricopeptide (TPR) repeat protein
MFHFHRRDWAGAAERFLKLGADSIHFPLLDNYLACLHNLGKFLECFALATKRIAAQPDFNPTLHELAARCAYHANDLRSAQKHFESLVQHEVRDVVKHQKMLAQVYLRLDEPDKAFGVLKKAYAKAARDIDVLIGLGLVSTLKKQHHEAVAYAFAAVNGARKNPRAHMALVKTVLDCPPDFKLDQKHRKAFQRSLEFLNKHPSGFIKAIPFENDLKSIIAMAKARSDHARQIEDLTRDKDLPMSILAKQLGLTPFQAWMGFIGHTKLHVRTAYGTSEEQAKELQTARAATAISVDAFALFTLRLLKCLDLLPKLSLKVYVHTKIFEAIVEDIREMEIRNSCLTIGYHEGRLIRSEAGPEQIQERLSLLRDIREFLKSPAVELVGLDAGFVSTEDMATAREFLGAKYYEPILVAKSRAVIYYADDAPMRSLASNSHGVSCFGSQALLRAARERNLLNDQQYEDAIITLLRHNYHFVSETYETLRRLAESEGFEPSELAKRLLRRAADPNVDQATSIRILGDFCFFIWSADLSKSKTGRDVWLGLCLDSILSTKQPERLFVHFLANLGFRALTLPVVFDGITTWILRSGKVSNLQRSLLYLGVQEAIVQMAALAKQECPWWPLLHKQWWEIGRMNVLSQRNGWIQIHPW